MGGVEDKDGRRKTEADTAPDNDSDQESGLVTPHNE